MKSGSGDGEHTPDSAGAGNPGTGGAKGQTQTEEPLP